MTQPKADSEPLFNDISWMLQSEKVSDQELVEALVDRYYDEFCQLGSLIFSPTFPDPKGAIHQIHTAVRRVISSAVVRRHKYWGEKPIAFYLVRELAYDLCGRREGKFSLWRRRIPAENLLVLLLLLLHQYELSPKDAAEIIRISEKKLSLLIREAEAKAESLAEAVGRSKIPIGITVNRSAEGELEAVRLAGSAGAFGNESHPILTAYIFSLVEQQRSKGHLRFTSREGILVGIFILMIFTVLWSTKLLEASDQRLLLTPSPEQSRQKSDALWYVYQVQPGDTLAEIAHLSRVREQLILAHNPGINPDFLKQGQTLRLPLQPLLRERTVQTPAARGEYLPALTSQSPLEEILDRSQKSSRQWQTLWADSYSVDYGEPGYIGPPFYLLHGQIWSSQPDQILLAQGFFPEGVALWSWQLGDVLLEKWHGDQNFTGSFIRSETLDLYAYLYFNQAAYSELTVIGEGSTANRPALILEGKDAGGSTFEKIWLDAVTGVALRHQTIDRRSGVVLFEHVLREIRYDVDIPPEVFSPGSAWHAEYRGNFGGSEMVESSFKSAPEWATVREVPEPFPYKLAEPPKLTELPVLLVWPNDWDYFISGNYQSASYKAKELIKVYAGNDFMGSLTFGDQQFRTCRRSPDGASVAIISQDYRVWGIINLHWFRVERPIHSTKIPFSPHTASHSNLAFSPDSSRLAFFGCLEEEECGLKVLDLETEQITVFLTGYSRFYGNFDLVWSTSGETIGFLEKFYDGEGRASCRSSVVDAANGDILSQIEPGACPLDEPEMGRVINLYQAGPGCMWPAEHNHE